MGSPATITDFNIIFFDGVCTLCNRSIDHIIRHDQEGQFKFASLQSDFAHGFLQEYSYDSNGLNSVVFYREGRLYERSDAILQILRISNSPWKWLVFFSWLPRKLRDLVYTMVARNRYWVFGRKETCRIPSPEERARFLDSYELA